MSDAYQHEDRQLFFNPDDGNHRPFYVDDPYLSPFRDDIGNLINHTWRIYDRITDKGKHSLDSFAAAHEYYGLHRQGSEWVFREWAPMASQITLIGDFNEWNASEKYQFTRLNPNGDWELKLPADAISHGMHYKLLMQWNGGTGERIPAFARRVTQNPQTNLFATQVWQPEPYQWRHATPAKPSKCFIYEAHVGMATEAQGVGTYNEFRINILPRIKAAGYNTIQLMAIQEHPYYGSFGYHVSSFYAPSSRFGTPEELKQLIDDAHGMGLRVIMDLVHSHAVANEAEGLSRYDGTPFQFFHDGPRGHHPAWGSRCFDYGKPAVIHFLLSNCRYWLDEFHIDGFRFDGITSMLYHHRGLGNAFSSYNDYYCGDLDEDAVAYLTLANALIHKVAPQAITIAEDVSGLPGLAAPVTAGGIGFDYRLAMGLPDAWFHTVRKLRDEDWVMSGLFHHLVNRRNEEKTISYVESHDQAIVGDKTMIFELLDAAMYQDMHKGSQNLIVDRGIALHKMIRLATASSAPDGYLNFMGNEFGHPEWIDFPREGNSWSYHYARRQWSLLDNHDLRYAMLAAFDATMVKTLTQYAAPQDSVQLVCAHDSDQILAFRHGKLLLVFNFHPETSFPHYGLNVGKSQWKLLFDSDEVRFNGFGRITPDQVWDSQEVDTGLGSKRHQIKLYLPARSALVLVRTDQQEKPS